MKCPDDGMLRAHLDSELAKAEENSIHEHLRSCAACQARSEGIAGRASSVGHLLRAAAAGPAIDPVIAYGRYRQRFGSRLEGRIDIGERLLSFWKRPIWGGVAVFSILAVLFSFAPARTWGQKILQMLRVQKVTVVPLNLSALTETGGTETGSRKPEKLIAQLISDNVVVTMDPGKPASVTNPDIASQIAGFKVRTLDGAGAPADIRVTNEGAFHMTVDRDRMQAILDQAARSDIQIPQSVDGSTVAVHIPKLVRLRYGNCPEGEKDDAPGLKSASGDESCMAFVQVPSPTVSVPPTLNIAALAEAGLQFAGMSAAEAHSFTQTVDWSSTLVIPIPQNGGSYHSVSVDGANGTLIELAPHGNFQGTYSLVWVKNGIIYSLDGRGSSSRALAAAASLD